MVLSNRRVVVPFLFAVTPAEEIVKIGWVVGSSSLQELKVATKDREKQW